jgi:hypothetical protein
MEFVNSEWSKYVSEVSPVNCYFEKMSFTQIEKIIELQNGYETGYIVVNLLDSSHYTNICEALLTYYDPTSPIWLMRYSPDVILATRNKLFVYTRKIPIDVFIEGNWDIIIRIGDPLQTYTEYIKIYNKSNEYPVLK